MTADAATDAGRPPAQRNHGRALLFLASIAAGVANYAFGLLCVHQLGAVTYADVAAVTSISMILTVPLSGLQSAYGRDVAIAAGSADEGRLSDLRAFGLGQAVRLQALVLVCGMIAVPILTNWGGVDDLRIALALPLLMLGTTVVPIFSGFLQGAERYTGLSLVMGLGGVLRIFIAPFGILAAGAFGALMAGVIGTIAAAAAALLLVHRIGARDTSRAGHAASGRPTTTTIATLALIAYAVLANADLSLAPVVLSEREAGDYAAATIAGRGMAFIAATVSMILLTSISRRIAQGLDTWGPLRRVLQLMGGLGIALAAACAVIPDDVYGTLFGTAGDVNVIVALSVLALTAVGMVNNLLSFALAHRMRWFVLVTLGAAVVFVAGSLAFVHTGVQLCAFLLGVAACVMVGFFARTRGSGVPAATEG